MAPRGEHLQLLSMAEAWLLGELGEKPCWSWHNPAHHLWIMKAPQRGEQGLGRKSHSFGIQSGSTREPQLTQSRVGLQGSSLEGMQKIF